MTPENTPEWTALHAAKHDTLTWFKDAKYGMFIHWGLYSQLAGIYKGQRMEEGRSPRVAEWIMHAFDIPRAEYKELAAQFNPTEFSAKEWVSVAKAAGMQYMVLTSKHHDGFALFDSKVSDFTSVKASPCQRDFVKELQEECDRQGLAFGLYYSHGMDWMDGGDGGQADYKATSGKTIGLHGYNDWDPSPVNYDTYVEQKGLPQVREILTQYPGLKLIWFDMNYHMPDHHSFQFYQTVSRLSPSTLVSDRVGNDYGDYGGAGDNVIPEEAELSEDVWETVGTTNNSWGYKSYDEDWKQPTEVLFWIIEILSKGGNYMLNIGPRGDGSIPEESVRILKEVGAWIRANGEAIYGTSPWTVHKEGPTTLSMGGTHIREKEGFSTTFTPEDFWFTSKGSDVFALSLCPELPEEITVQSVDPSRVVAVHHVGSDTELAFHANEEDLVVSTQGLPSSDLAHAFRISLTSAL